MNIMNNRILMTVLWLGLMVGSVHAQITSVSGTVRDEMETLIGATGCEVDQRYDYGFQRPFCHEGEEHEE